MQLHSPGITYTGEVPLVDKSYVFYSRQYLRPYTIQLIVACKVAV